MSLISSVITIQLLIALCGATAVPFPYYDKGEYNFPCVRRAECLRIYGTDPQDVADYGNIQPCGIGLVRCIATVGGRPDDMRISSQMRMHPHPMQMRPSPQGRPPRRFRMRMRGPPRMPPATFVVPPAMTLPSEESSIIIPAPLKVTAMSTTTTTESTTSTTTTPTTSSMISTTTPITSSQSTMSTATTPATTTTSTTTTASGPSTTVSTTTTVVSNSINSDLILDFVEPMPKTNSKSMATKSAMEMIAIDFVTPSVPLDLEIMS